MNKSDLMNRLAEEKGFSLSTAREIVDIFFDDMTSQYISTTTSPESWGQSQCSLKPSGLMISQFFELYDILGFGIRNELRRGWNFYKLEAIFSSKK